MFEMIDYLVILTLHLMLFFCQERIDSFYIEFNMYELMR